MLFNKSIIFSLLIYVFFVTACSPLYSLQASNKLQHLYLEPISGDTNFTLYHTLLRRLNLPNYPNDIQYKLSITLSDISHGIGLTRKQGNIQSIYIIRAKGEIIGNTTIKKFQTQKLCSVPNTSNASSANYASSKTYLRCLNYVSTEIIKKVYKILNDTSNF